MLSLFLRQYVQRKISSHSLKTKPNITNQRLCSLLALVETFLLLLYRCRRLLLRFDLDTGKNITGLIMVIIWEANKTPCLFAQEYSLIRCFGSTGFILQLIKIFDCWIGFSWSRLSRPYVWRPQSAASIRMFVTCSMSPIAEFHQKDSKDVRHIDMCRENWNSSMIFMLVAVDCELLCWFHDSIAIHLWAGLFVDSLSAGSRTHRYRPLVCHSCLMLRLRWQLSDLPAARLMLETGIVTIHCNSLSLNYVRYLRSVFVSLTE